MVECCCSCSGRHHPSPLPHCPPCHTTGIGQGGVAGIAKYMEAVCAQSLWQRQATRARAHREAKIAVVPAVGEQATFTDREPQGSSKVSAEFKILWLGLPPPPSPPAESTGTALIAHKRHEANTSLIHLLLAEA